MKKEFENAKVDFIRFESTDIITASNNSSQDDTTTGNGEGGF